MDFDTAKENIQPLRQGRRVDRLEAAFGEQSKESLENERRQYEEAITSYDGHDPLSIWFEYICWIEQSFPKGGAECGLDEAVLKCIVHFENDQRYRQDRRMIKLFIKYIDTQKDPHELYNQLYNNGIGTLVADLYVAWSYYYDALNNYKQVETIFRKGFDAGAQPIEELSQAHQAFSISMSKRMLYDDEDSKKQFQVTMEEKRSALTSLRAHKKRNVGSIRTGIAVKHENPGIVHQEPIQSFGSKKYEVHEHDDDAGAAALPSNISVIRSIVDSSRKKENAHEPGPWNKAKIGKSGGLFGQSGTSVQPDFNIMEDDSLPPIHCPEKLFEKGIQLPSHWVSRNKAQQPWNVPVVVDEPVVQRVIPCYEKFFLYPNASTEISADEYRGYKWHKDREMTHPLTQMYDRIWINELENGIRLPPGFALKNVPQVETENFSTFIADSESQNHLQIPFKKMVDGNEEKSMEELLADKFARGGIQLLTNADFEEIDAMDETIIGDRRQSVYPSSRMSFVPRKSIMPRKSVLMAAPLTEEDEQEAETPHVQFVAPSLGAIRKSLTKRKLVENYEHNMEDEKFRSSLKKENVSETPPRSVFKPPAPVEKKPTRLPNFEDEDPNDSCSTQQFNFFIKAQSVSTPVSKKSAAKAASEAFTETGRDVEEIVVSRSSATPPDHVMPKQLSTIMETTETTQSTKSSVCDNDTVFNPKTPKDRQDVRPQVSQQEVEKLLYNNLITSFRLPEEQTETCTKIVLATRAHFNTDGNQSNFKYTTPAKSFRIASPSTPGLPIEVFDSLPSQPSIISIKSSESEMSMKFSEPEAVKHEDAGTAKVINTFMVQEPKLEFEIPATQEVSQLIVPELENFEIPETQAFDVPPTQDETKMDIPAIDSDVTMLPPTQDFEVQSEKFDVPATQNDPNADNPPPYSESESFEIPATQNTTKLETPQVNGNPTIEHFDIAETQEVTHLVIPATQEDTHLVIPATQEDTHLDVPELDEFELPETQQIVEIPATQDSTAECHKITPSISSEAANKPDVVSFCIYEDSVRENPGAVAGQKFLPEDEATGFLHMSRKENLIIPPKITQRTASDEFLLLLASPVKSQSMMKDTSKTGHQEEVSDLLKFSCHLETSIKNLSIDQPRSATPTNTFPNFMEDDLNTEKFSLALGSFKNSTLLCDYGKKSSLPDNDDFNLSIALNEDEMEMLGLKSKVKTEDKPVEPEFKIPTIPMAKPPTKPAQKAVFKIFEDTEGVANEEEDDGDMSKSIYKPRPQHELELEEEHEWSQEEMCSFIETPANRYEHTLLEGSNISMKVQDEISKADGNPFDERVRQAMLDDCNFSQYLEEHVKTCKLLNKIPSIKPGVTISTYGDEFKVLKFIAKGTFGSIFTAKSSSTNNIVALKQEKPPNLWEYYICIELLDRLKDKRMIPAFMKIDFAVIANNSSVLITTFSPYGTIIDVCNKHKNATYKNVDEYVVMVLTTQMLSIMDHLHAAKIIHADIKPDNFLVMSRIEFGNKTPSLQLIDFGTSIDMDWYSRGETFTTPVTTENFVCCEMQEGRPWTYQTDLFGLAGTAHVMLFGKYMTVEKKLQTWNIKSRYPRYFNKFLWDRFFTELLNIPDCSSMPNLQAMKDGFEEILQSKKKYICDKISEFNQAIEM